MTSCTRLFLLLWGWGAFRLVWGEIVNGTCRLAVFAPFSYAALLGTYFENGPFKDDEEVTLNNLGFSHMAASFLSMQHFNDRDSSIVPELADEVYQNCEIRFDIENTSVYDSETILNFAAGERLLADQAEHGSFPCAIAGPYNDFTGRILSVLAGSAQVPLTMHRTFNYRLTDPFLSPFSSQVYPDIFSTGQVLLNFLEYRGIDNYVSLLYTPRDTSTQQHDVVSGFLGRAGIKHRSYRYIIPDFDSQDVLDPGDLLVPVLTRIKAVGFKTIIVMMEYPEDETHRIAVAAEEMGMNGGDYFWVFVGIDLSVFYFYPPDLYVEDLKLLAGSAMLSPLEGFLFDEHDRFFKAWTAIKDASFIGRLNQMNPLNYGSPFPTPFYSGVESLFFDSNCTENCTFRPGSLVAASDFFQKVAPPSGSGFMFDAVMATGMGACLAAEKSSGIMNSTSHRDGILSVNFTGATGRVVLGDSNFVRNARDPSYVSYGIVNLFPIFEGEEPNLEWFESLLDHPRKGERAVYRITDILETNGGPIKEAKWKSIAPFQYRSGLTVPARQYEPESNYLKVGIRATGLAFMSFILLASVLVAVWVFVNRSHRILRAAQPYSLYLVCFGSFLLALGILPLSFDESYGWSTDQLSSGCMAVVWLVSLGQIITYGALFSKLWRVNRLLQFQRTTVHVRNVAWPVVIMVFAAIAVLSAMTAAGPLTWEREIIDNDTDESIGRCDSEYFGAFVWPLGIIMVISMLVTAFMAWRTNDVDDALSESWWIFILIVIQVEVVIIGVPVVIILRDLNTTGRYFGSVFIIWTFPASALSLIMLPKMIAHRRAVRGVARQAMRGASTGVVHVTGISRGDRNASTSKSQDDTIILAMELLGNKGSSTELPSSGHGQPDEAPSTTIGNKGSSTELPSSENGQPGKAPSTTIGNKGSSTELPSSENGQPDKVPSTTVETSGEEAGTK